MAYIRALSAIACLSLGACGGAPVAPSKLEGPAAALMVAPERLPALRSGDDLVKSHASLRRSYGREASKLRRLQTYVRKVRR